MECVLKFFALPMAGERLKLNTKKFWRLYDEIVTIDGKHWYLNIWIFQMLAAIAEKKT